MAFLAGALVLSLGAIVTVVLRERGGADQQAELSVGQRRGCMSCRSGCRGHCTWLTAPLNAVLLHSRTSVHHSLSTLVTLNTNLHSTR
eukprot:365978-Chlamydomonas_euryale.AAC.9